MSISKVFSSISFRDRDRYSLSPGMQRVRDPEIFYKLNNQNKNEIEKLFKEFIINYFTNELIRKYYIRIFTGWEIL